MMDLIEAVRKELFRRKYSNKTIISYLACLKHFFRDYGKEPRKITKKDIIDYLDLLASKGASGSTMNVNLQALKFALKSVLNKNFLINVKFSKTPKSIPTVLTKNETAKLLNSIENSKHRLMTKLLYSAGLRVNELLNLKAKDFEFEMNYGWVRNGKGNKDRMFIIAESIKNELIKYINENKIDYGSFVFRSYNGKMSARTVQEILKKAGKKAGIMKNVHPHTLRHSYATHLIENGYDLDSVQTLLGHNSPETTRMYLHTSNIKILNVKSPIDSLQTDLQPKNSNKKLNPEKQENEESSPLA